MTQKRSYHLLRLQLTVKLNAKEEKKGNQNTLFEKSFIYFIYFTYLFIYYILSNPGRNLTNKIVAVFFVLFYRFRFPLGWGGGGWGGGAKAIKLKKNFVVCIFIFTLGGVIQQIYKKIIRQYKTNHHVLTCVHFSVTRYKF